ncbi:hypothetical protein [Nocardioides sp.]|uniref:rolling circle replication-associated protein n=1 Tax=Nocardioides sp. TaxID=35761 RepID=UPI0039E52BFF
MTAGVDEFRNTAIADLRNSSSFVAAEDLAYTKLVGGLGAGFATPAAVDAAASLFARAVVPERPVWRWVSSSRLMARSLVASQARLADVVAFSDRYSRGGERRLVSLGRADRCFQEGPRWRVEIAPGKIALRRRDPVRAERAAERARVAAEKKAEMVAAITRASECFPGCKCGEHWTPPEGGVSRIYSWSAKSRSRMLERLAELDYAPLLAHGGVPAMITLTYPDRWQEVAPSAAVAYRHLRALERRWYRRWGVKLVCVWKREFQRRGAPHWHLLATPPADPEFRRWLALEWADIVGTQDWCGGWCWDRDWTAMTGGPMGCCERGKHVLVHLHPSVVDVHEGARVLDPKRLAIYFGKHGVFSAKDYQNQAPAEWVHDPACDGTDVEGQPCRGCAPDGVGHYWGVWGLEKAVATVEVYADVAEQLRRAVRRWSRSHRYYAPRTVWRKEYATRLDPTTGELVESWRWRTRRSKKAVYWMRGTAGYVLANDGPALAEHLARLAGLVEVPREATVHRHPVTGRLRRGRSGVGPAGFLP